MLRLFYLPLFFMAVCSSTALYASSSSSYSSDDDSSDILVGRGSIVLDLSRFLVRKDSSENLPSPHPSICRSPGFFLNLNEVLGATKTTLSSRRSLGQRTASFNMLVDELLKLTPSSECRRKKVARDDLKAQNAMKAFLSPRPALSLEELISKNDYTREDKIEELLTLFQSQLQIYNGDDVRHVPRELKFSDLSPRIQAIADLSIDEFGILIDQLREIFFQEYIYECNTERSSWEEYAYEESDSVEMGGDSDEDTSCSPGFERAILLNTLRGCVHVKK